MYPYPRKQMHVKTHLRSELSTAPLAQGDNNQNHLLTLERHLMISAESHHFVIANRRCISDVVLQISPSCVVTRKN